jgi:hypothetical protein
VSDHEPNQASDSETIGSASSASKLPNVTPAPAETHIKESSAVDAPNIVPEQSAAEPVKDAPKAEPAKAETPKVEAAKADAPKVDAKPSAFPGQILIMPPDKSWSGDRAGQDERAAGRSGVFGQRRAAAMVAVVALAAVAGAVGGAAATVGLGHVTGVETKAPDNRALEDSIARIDTEIAALRNSLEQASKHAASQFSKSGDRLDRIEKAQVEPAAKLAKLTEAVDKLRTAAVVTPPSAPTPASAAVAAAPVAPGPPKETTATIQTANAAPGPVPVPAPKPEVARLPTVEGWVLRDVSNGVALIEGRQGIFEVYAGDPIPGLGRIDAIRKQDGRWVVVTSRGLIVGR